MADLPQHRCDLLIIGAGPTGLYAAYYAGFRGLSVAVVDSLPTVGGQVSTLFPEKAIYDVPGFARIIGRDLITRLVEQAATAEPAYLLGRTATTLQRTADRIMVDLDDGTTVSAGAVLITAGVGRFRPRPLPLGAGWEGRGLDYFVTDTRRYDSTDVIVVGGGDSALDWALHLEPVARSVTLVHRRDAFRAHAGSIRALHASTVTVRTRAQLHQILGTEGIEAVELTRAGGEPERRPAQAVIAALGFVADLGPLADWGVAIHQRRMLVDACMRTNLDRVFAAGDIADFPGKVRLISVGFGEAATAVNHAAALLTPGAEVFPGHSSELAGRARTLGPAEARRPT